MDEMNRNEQRPVNPRRRKRSKMQIIKEVYLPVIIAGIALVLILVFVIGSIVRAVQRSQYNAQMNLEASIAAQEEAARIDAEAKNLLAQAAVLAQQADYDTAIAALNSFSGNFQDYPELQNKITEYSQARERLVLWDDTSKVLNLSFQMLIADPERAFTNATFGSSYRQNFVTVTEFTRILQQLYDNGYMLVSLKDITSPEGPMELYLPEGKKPLIITQTNVNYYTYMVDGDGDKLPDKDGAGFANRLVLDADGNIVCEYVDANGQTVTGAYDLVPILDSFVESHPDFSYKGAKAILAVSGYDGVFGYRTNPGAEERLGRPAYEQEVQKAKRVVNRLIQTGYELACYTYENEPYGSYTADQIKNELEKWETEVTPILGATDIFVFARNSDIATTATAYSGEKFYTLKNAGFDYYLGFCENGTPWYSSHGDYIRQGRILVCGESLINNASWFEGILNPSEVLDEAR